MKTREIIERIPEVNRGTIELYSDIIKDHTARNDLAGATEYACKLRGYLACMKDVGVLTDYELRALYLWYRALRVSRAEK